MRIALMWCFMLLRETGPMDIVAQGSRIPRGCLFTNLADSVTQGSLVPLGFPSLQPLLRLLLCQSRLALYLLPRILKAVMRLKKRWPFTVGLGSGGSGPHLGPCLGFAWPCKFGI